MISLGVFGRHCQFHHKEVIANICLDICCSNRILCPVCQDNHDQTHKSYIKPITYFLKSDIKQEVQKAQDTLSHIEMFNENMKIKFEAMLDQIEQEVSQLIETKKQEVTKTLKSPISNKKEYWNTYEEEFYDLFNHCLNTQEADNDHGFILLSTFIEKFIEFQSEMQSLQEMNILSHYEKSLSYKQVEQLHSKLMGDIQKSLNSFEDSLFDHLPLYKMEQKMQINKGNELINKPSTFEIEKLKIQQYINLSAPVGWDSIEYLEDFNTFAFGNDLGNLEFWSVPEFKLIGTHKLHKNYINCIKYSKAKKRIITASVDKTVNTFEVLDGLKLKPLTVLTHHTDKVYAILILEAFNIFVTSGKDPDLKVFDLKNCSFKYKIKTNEKNYTGTKMEFIPKVNLLAVTFKQGLICFYNIKTGEEVFNLKTLSTEWIHAILYQENMNQLFVGTGKGRIMSWRLTDKGFFQESELYHIPGDVPCTILPAPNKKGLIVSSKLSKIFYLDLETKDSHSSGEFGFPMCVVMKDVPNLKKILVAGSENKVAIIDYD